MSRCDTCKFSLCNDNNCPIEIHGKEDECTDYEKMIFLKGMNELEKIAYEYLLSKGYSPEQITFNPRLSPDYETNDGKGWEVKRPDLNFTWGQIQHMDYSTTILIVDNNGSITEKPFYEVLMGKHKVDNYPSDIDSRSRRLIQWIDKEKNTKESVMAFAEPIDKKILNE